jgi:zinc transporter ZupT
VIGNGLLSVAIWRSGSLPKWAGVIWGVATLIFYVLGAALGMATTGASLPTQPIGAALMAIAAAWIAWAAYRLLGDRSRNTDVKVPSV